jgi:hypothetical protein
MQQLDLTKRFHLLARRRSTNQDELITEFNDEKQLYSQLDLVNQEEYKEASILEFTKDNVFPTCRMYVEFKDNRPYFEKIKKRVR